MLVMLCVLTILALASTVSAQDIPVGISKGDSFTYDSSYLWSSTNQSESVPDDALEANLTSQIQIVVTSISGSLINASKTYHYRNGSTETIDGYADVSSGDNEEVGAFFFVSSNLSVGDMVYPSGLYADVINQTSEQNVAGAQREVLLDSSTFHFEYGSPNSQVLDSQIYYYFDRLTGVCVEQREQTTVTDQLTRVSETIISTLKLVETNVWGNGGSSEFPLLPFAIATVAAVVVSGFIVLFVYRKMHSRSNIVENS
jgi:hypothetical protein